jgi:hypothetical protein
MVLGITVLATNAIAGVWGGIFWLRREPSVAFWYLLRIAQATVVGQVLLGLMLLAGGERPPAELHIVYGLAPLVVTLVSEGMRIGAAQAELAGVGDVEQLERREQVKVARRVVRREMGVMTVGALLIVTLALRAIALGNG